MITQIVSTEATLKQRTARRRTRAAFGVAAALIVAGGVLVWRVGGSDGSAGTPSRVTSVSSAPVQGGPASDAGELPGVGSHATDVPLTYILVGSEAEANTARQRLVESNMIRRENGVRDQNAVVMVAGSADTDERIRSEIDGLSAIRTLNGLQGIQVIDLRLP